MTGSGGAGTYALGVTPTGVSGISMTASYTCPNNVPTVPPSGHSDAVSSLRLVGTVTGTGGSAGVTLRGY